MRWDVKKIIEDHGGAIGLASTLQSEGRNVSVKAVRQWLRRDNIPPNWMATILAINGHNPKDWIAEDEPEVEDIF